MLKLFKLLSKKEYGWFGCSLVFIVAQVWLDLKMPEYMSAITQLVQTPGSEMSKILINGGYMLLCAVGSMAASMITGYFAARIASGLSKSIRDKVFKKVLGFNSEEIGRFSTASLITRTTNDITQVQMIVSMGMQAIVKAPILLVWAVAKIAGKQWQWSVATACAVGVIMVVLMIAVVLALPKFQIIQNLTDNLNRVTRENLTGIRVVRAYNAQKFQEGKFDQANEELMKTNLFANRVMALLNPTMSVLSSGISLAIYWIGAVLINAADMMDRLTIFSDMVVFSNYAMQVIMAFTIKSYIPAIVIALILGGVGALFSVIGPDKISDITNLIADGLMGVMDMDAIVDICIVLVVLYGLSWVFSYVQSFILTTVTQRLSKSLRGDISRKINRMPLRYFDSTSFGDVLSRVTNDVDTIGQMLNNSLGSLISSVTMLVGSLFMMFVTNALMAGSAIAASLVGFVLMMVIMMRSQKYFTAQQETLGAINGHIEEIYAGHKVVRVYNGEEKAEQKFDELNGSLYDSAWKSQFFSGLMMPLMGFIGNFGYVVVCVLGAVLAANGTIKFGTIVSFMIYIRLFTQPLSQIAQVFTSMQSALAASERVFDFLNEEELEDESGKTNVLTHVRGDVEFKNVNFGYRKEKTIIHDFSAKAKGGQTIAIVGPTGAGKTTIVNLLMRFYETNSGEILIDGVPIRELTRENIADLFGMVLQDTWLFEGTLRENIAYSKEGVTDADLDRVCAAVGLTHYVRSLPKGYDTVLNEQTTMSAGQRQLVTIARAMIENAPLLILDEATSSVDTKTELLVQEAMAKLTEGRTSFVIAHRLSTIKNADLILVMKDGDIIESGSHKELLAQGGFYAELYNSQFEQVS